MKQYRNSRGGQNYNRRVWDTNNGVNLNNIKALPQAIPSIVTNRDCPSISSTYEKSNSINSHNVVKVKYESSSNVKAQKCISVCSFNPRSVKNKTLSFCDYIQSNDFDVVAITETWLGSRVDKTCLSELVPNGYQIKHVPRGGGGKRGGGVAIIH